VSVRERQDDAVETPVAGPPPSKDAARQGREETALGPSSKTPAAIPSSQLAKAAGPLRRAFSALQRIFFGTLARQALLSVFGVVLLLEVAIYSVSVGARWEEVLTERLSSVQLAVLAREAARGEGEGLPGLPDPLPGEGTDGQTGTDRPLPEDLERRLLEQSGVLVVALQRGPRREILLGSPPYPDSVRVINLDVIRADTWASVRGAFDTLLNGGERYITIVGPEDNGNRIEALLSDRMIADALWGYTWNILLLSLLIAVGTAAALFLVIYFALIRPLRRLIGAMTAFQEAPEDPRRLVVARSGTREVREAEDALHDMQTEIRAALHQKTRLAALGTAVSKINHDLRNILASSQLITDRLAQSEDPSVQRMAPKLVSAIDRAVNLCTQTLRYGRAEERAPEIAELSLAKLIEDVFSTVAPDAAVSLVNDVPPDFTLVADSDQIFRVLLNLVRNASQAMEGSEGGEVRVSAEHAGAEAVICVSDTGPGIPEKVRERLFQAFVSSARAGGTGLGLAIAQELVQAHGGHIDLVKSDAAGTTFRIRIPQD